MTPKKTHIVATTMLFAAAVLPASPLWTLGAYGDTETSSQNMLQAGEWVNELALFSLRLDEPGEAVIEDGEVAGTSTDPVVPEEPVVEVGEPVVETTIGEEPPVEESAPEDQVVEVSEPVVEVAAPQPAPESDPQPAPTSSEESAS